MSAEVSFVKMHVLVIGKSHRVVSVIFMFLSRAMSMSKLSGSNDVVKSRKFSVLSADFNKSSVSCIMAVSVICSHQCEFRPNHNNCRVKKVGKVSREK